MANLAEDFRALTGCDILYSLSVTYPKYHPFHSNGAMAIIVAYRQKLAAALGEPRFGYHVEAPDGAMYTRETCPPLEELMQWVSGKSIDVKTIDGQRLIKLRMADGQKFFYATTSQTMVEDKRRLLQLWENKKKWLCATNRHNSEMRAYYRAYLCPKSILDRWDVKPILADPILPEEDEATQLAHPEAPAGWVEKPAPCEPGTSVNNSAFHKLVCKEWQSCASYYGLGGSFYFVLTMADGQKFYYPTTEETCQEDFHQLCARRSERDLRILQRKHTDPRIRNYFIQYYALAKGIIF